MFADARRYLGRRIRIDSGLVFTTGLEGWIDPNNLGRLMDALIDKAGVPRITPKGMRHTAQWVGQMVVGDDKVRQERLGHAVTLNTYTHTVSEQHGWAGERLDAVFTGFQLIPVTMVRSAGWD